MHQNFPLAEGNNENEINTRNEIVNIPPPPNNYVEFDISNVQVPVSSFDED